MFKGCRILDTCAFWWVLLFLLWKLLPCEYPVIFWIDRKEKKRKREAVVEPDENSVDDYADIDETGNYMRLKLTLLAPFAVNVN